MECGFGEHKARHQNKRTPYCWVQMTRYLPQADSGVGSNPWLMAKDTSHHKVGVPSPQVNKPVRPADIWQNI